MRKKTREDHLRDREDEAKAFLAASHNIGRDRPDFMGFAVDRGATLAKLRNLRGRKDGEYRPRAMKTADWLILVFAILGFVVVGWMIFG